MSAPFTAPASSSKAPESPLAAPDPRLQAVVVVPARDEAERVGACLRALADQRDVDDGAYEVVVVLDGCRDATRDRVFEVGADRADLRLHVVELGVSSGVGRARRFGMDLACERLFAVSRAGGLIASTDADSVVAGNWLAAQLVLVRAGAQAIGGRIELDDREARALPLQALERREDEAVRRMRAVLEQGVDRDQPIAEHHQFSGASLALTATVYRECGGLPVSAPLEDEALERELSNRGIPICRSGSVRVSTSARTEGRAARGLAHNLANWSARI